jgi:putative phosphoesterase
MKIGVLSDTHLSRVTRELQDIVEHRFKGVDLILHAGDIVSGEVLAYLEAYGAVAVQGNMDQAEVTRTLPVKRVVTTGAFRIGLIHGFGSPRGLAEMIRREFEEIDCLVFGHSHQPMNRRAGSELWFNPGAVSGGSGGPSVGLLTVGETITGEILAL